MSDSWNTEKNWRRMKEDQRAVRTGKKKWIPKLYKDSGKGDSRRDSNIDSEEYAIKWDLAFGKITKEEFDKRMNELDNTMG